MINMLEKKTKNVDLYCIHMRTALRVGLHMHYWDVSSINGRDHNTDVAMCAMRAGWFHSRTHH